MESKLFSEFMGKLGVKRFCMIAKKNDWSQTEYECCTRYWKSMGIENVGIEWQ